MVMPSLLDRSNRLSIAITKVCIDFQVFGWGDNSSGQLGLHENKYLQPQKITVSLLIVSSTELNAEGRGCYYMLL